MKEQWELRRPEKVVVIILVSFIIAAMAMHYWKLAHREATDSAVKVERQVVRARADGPPREMPQGWRVANEASNWKPVPAPTPVSQYERSANKFGLTLNGTRQMTIAVTTATANR